VIMSLVSGTSTANPSQLADPQREIGSTGVNDSVLRDETEPHQACGDGPNFSLMGGGNRCNRFACLERGAQRSSSPALQERPCRSGAPLALFRAI
jgi:hypothetical protein